VSGVYEKKYTIEGARQKLKELQEGGLALNISSLEDPIPAMAVPAPAPAEVIENIVETVRSAPSSDSKQYRKFLTTLKADLQELLKLIES